jgi:hypothetical protein
MTTLLITLIAIAITLFIIGLIDAFKPPNRPKLDNTILMWCLVILVYPFACAWAMDIVLIRDNWTGFNLSRSISVYYAVLYVLSRYYGMVYVVILGMSTYDSLCSQG